MSAASAFVVCCCAIRSWSKRENSSSSSDRAPIAVYLSIASFTCACVPSTPISSSAAASSRDEIRPDASTSAFLNAAAARRSSRARRPSVPPARRSNLGRAPRTRRGSGRAPAAARPVVWRLTTSAATASSTECPRRASARCRGDGGGGERWRRWRWWQRQSHTCSSGASILPEPSVSKRPNAASTRPAAVAASRVASKCHASTSRTNSPKVMTSTPEPCSYRARIAAAPSADTRRPRASRANLSSPSST